RSASNQTDRESFHGTPPYCWCPSRTSPPTPNCVDGSDFLDWSKAHCEVSIANRRCARRRRARWTMQNGTQFELDSAALSSTVAFTGRLACMTRAEAFELVRSHGGTPSQTVTRQTDVVVVGELGWPLLDDGRPSNKLSRAGTYGIPVVSERRFLEWIGKAVPDSLNRTYSTGQIIEQAFTRHR